MTAVIENRTDLPRAVVVRTVVWTLRQMRIDRDDLCIRVRMTDGTGHVGHFYNGPVAQKQGFDFLITARIPREFVPYVMASRMKQGPTAIDPRTWREALVCIVAHEGMHVIQALRPRPDLGYHRKPASPHWRKTKKGSVWVEPKLVTVHVDRPMFSELEAEWAEHDLLKIYRGRRKQ